MEESFWGKRLDRIDKRHDQLDAVFHQLLVEPCLKVPKKGDRVLVASGLIGRGHVWQRMEGEVIESGDCTYLVRFKEFCSIRKGPDEEWCVAPLITEVLGSKGE